MSALVVGAVVAAVVGAVVGLTVVGATVVGVAVAATPLQDTPLSLQLTGWPPEPTNPKVVAAPTATDPFHPRLAKVTCCPDSVISASQKLPIAAPAGRSNSTFQEVMAAAPVLLTVTSSCQPLPQSDTVRTDAVGAAADAGRAIQVVAAAATAATTVRMRVRLRRIGELLQNGKGNGDPVILESRGEPSTGL